MTQDKILQLNDSLLIGKGRDRACYAHPEDETLCIKVALQSEKQSRREKDYLNYLNKKGRDLSHVSQFHGLLETSLGTGFLFDLARDRNGDIALTLKAAIKNKAIKETEVIRLIFNIEHYLSSQKICVYDLSPSNIVIYKDDFNKWQFIIIDGLGAVSQNPLIIRTNILTDNLLKRSFKQLKRKVDKVIKYTELNTVPPMKKRKSKLQKNLKNIGIAILIVLPLFTVFYFELFEV